MSERVQELQSNRIGKVVRAYERGMPLSTIATKVGVSPPTIAKWLTQEGYKHKNKGRIPLAMKARVRDLHLRGWSDAEISRLLNLGMDRVQEFSSPIENPILGGEKDPLKVKGQKPKRRKKKKTKKRSGSKKKDKEKPDWPPPRHKCRKHWNENEKAYVLELIGKGISPGAIYKRMRASRKRQVRIWREAGNEGLPPNFPPPRGEFEPQEGAKPMKESKRGAELRAAGEEQIAALEAAAEERKARIRQLEAEAAADEKRIKELSREAQAQARRLESAEAAMAKRRGLPAPKPTRRRVEAGSYEHEVLGLPVGSLAEPKQLGRPRTKKQTHEYADNGRYFTVSRDWADLSDAKKDELTMFAAYLTSKRFPARATKKGDQPKAYFEGQMPKKIEDRWVKTVDTGLDLLEKYRAKKMALRKNKMFSKRIAFWLESVYDGWRNPSLNSSQKASARNLAGERWAKLSKLEKLVMIYDMEYAEKGGMPTTLGIDRSQAAKILAEKAGRRASRKLIQRNIESKQKAVQAAATAPELPAADEDDISSMLAQAQNKFALPEGEDD